MVKKGFKMFPNPGMVEGYKKRRNALWLEMKEMTCQYGSHNYSIFLDKETDVLYEYLEVEDEALWTKSADMPMNHGWWDYTADIMEMNADNSPVCVDPVPMFHLG